MSEFIVIQGDLYRKTYIACVRFAPSSDRYVGPIQAHIYVERADGTSPTYFFSSDEEAIKERDRIVAELTGISAPTIMEDK